MKYIVIILDSDTLRLMAFINEGLIYPAAWSVVDKEPSRISLAAESHHLTHGHVPSQGSLHPWLTYVWGIKAHSSNPKSDTS